MTDRNQGAERQHTEAEIERALAAATFARSVLIPPATVADIAAIANYSTWRVLWEIWAACSVILIASGAFWAALATAVFAFLSWTHACYLAFKLKGR